MEQRSYLFHVAVYETSIFQLSILTFEVHGLWQVWLHVSSWDVADRLGLTGYTGCASFLLGFARSRDIIVHQVPPLDPDLFRTSN